MPLSKVKAALDITPGGASLPGLRVGLISSAPSGVSHFDENYRSISVHDLIGCERMPVREI